MSYENDEVAHAHMVRRLQKPGADILSTLTPERAELWHMASCVQSEAGELFDAVKKHVIHGKALDVQNVIEELGDLEFYLQGVRQNLNIFRGATLRANIDKLSQRYPGNIYSDAAAQARADKETGQ